jgi:glycerophosphoryl diester phosphodiesterase
MFDAWPRPLVIGHRGASALAPENTMAAFKLAIQHQADAIEFDVKLSSDKQVVIIHDSRVDRTTNGIGKVSDLTLARLNELDAGSKFASAFTGEKIPTLNQVFESLGKQILMNIELTNYSTPMDGLVEHVVELVRFHGLEDHVLFSSFYSRNLKAAQRLMPQVPCGLLTYPGWLGFFPRNFGWRKRFQALHPHLSDVSAILVNRSHSADKRIHVWTVNGEIEIQRILDLNVDGIFTDDPGALRKILEKRR